MLNFRRGIFRNQQLIPLIVAVVISAFLIILPLDLRTTASRIGTLSLLYPYSELDRYLRRIDTAFDANRELNRRLDSLSVLVSRLIENKYENDRLRAMLGFDLHLPLRLIPAEVVSVSFGYPYKSMVINAGSEMNIGPNMPVLTPSGIVGKTIAAGFHSSTVQLLYDPACRVAARIQASRAQGIITYAGGNFLTMRDVPAEESALVGDSVVTSGLGGIFPEGLFIGTVIKTEAREGGLFRDIKVLPGADISALDEVFVTPAVPTYPFLERQ
jgi:rod shape-determining protein MreC